MSLKTYIVASSLGERRWQAEDADHAREQHEDAFPDEPVLGVRLDEGIPAPGGTSGPVWLTEYASHLRTNILGIVSNPEKGRQACQDMANEYFGAKKTPPLNWHGDDRHASTSYTNPHETFFFQVTRFTVDEIREDTS